MVPHNAAHPSWTTFSYGCVACSFQCHSNGWTLVSNQVENKDDVSLQENEKLD